MDEFSLHVRDDNLRSELREIVAQLCDPDPRLRGDSTSRMRGASPFSMERYISRFDQLARRAEIGMIQG